MDALFASAGTPGMPWATGTLIQPEPWAQEALCAETDPEMFFPEKGGSTVEAKAVCARCDVAEQCLAYALRHHERHGIWGGYSAREIAKLRPSWEALGGSGVHEREHLLPRVDGRAGAHRADAAARPVHAGVVRDLADHVRARDEPEVGTDAADGDGRAVGGDVAGLLVDAKRAGGVIAEGHAPEATWPAAPAEGVREESSRAQLVMDDGPGFYGRAECTGCGWTGPRRIYPKVAHRDRDRHNDMKHRTGNS